MGTLRQNKDKDKGNLVQGNFLSLWCIMSKNGEANLVPFAARFLKCAWPFWDIMH